MDMEESAPTSRVSSPRQLSRVALGVSLLAAVIVVYWPVMVELVKDWMRDANYRHGFLILLISGYLIWQHRQQLGRTAVSPSILGLVGLLGALIMLVLGTAGAEVFTQRVSLILLLASLVLFLYGWGRFRVVAFPLAFLLLAVPLPYLIYYGLTGPMQAIAAKCAIWGLRIVGVPALAEGNIIHLQRTSLEIADACSGIRSFYAFLAIGALVAYSTSIPLWGRLVVFLVAIPLSIAGNAVRVWGSGMGAYLVGPEATHGTVHELFGILVFVVSLGIFVLFRGAARNLWSSGTQSPSSSSPSRDSIPEYFAPGGHARQKSRRSSSSPES